MGLMVKDLTFSFGDGDNQRYIFNRQNFLFDRGTLTCIRGASGSGKTTLLTLLSLIERPHVGEIFFDGQLLTDLSSTEAGKFRNSHIGLVFQTLRLIEVLTVREHFKLFGKIKQRPAAIRQGSVLMEQFGLGISLDALPKELSGGEKQRVALAQALSVDPPIVLADEPTAALDPENSQVIAKVLRDYAEKGNVVICVTHDNEVSQYAHQLIEIIKR